MIGKTTCDGNDIKRKINEIHTSSVMVKLLLQSHDITTSSKNLTMFLFCFWVMKQILTVCDYKINRISVFIKNLNRLSLYVR